MIPFVRHKVKRLKLGKTHVITCSCGQKLRGKDWIECNRNHELHVISEFQLTT